ncbi:hypothetical protein ES703_73464 [subsurface metagenome]
MMYPEAKNTMLGGREFDQWLGLTLSNKTWLWLFCTVAIGGSVGFILWKVSKSLKSFSVRLPRYSIEIKIRKR